MKAPGRDARGAKAGRGKPPDTNVWGQTMATNITAIAPESPATTVQPATAASAGAPVEPVAPTAPTGTATQGGSLPPGGETPPATGSTVTVSQAVDVINQVLRANAREFVFQLDSAGGQGRVTVINPQTGEIVRQIPEPHVLQLAETIASSGMPLTGLLVNSRA